MELNKIYNMDCMEGMAQFPDKFFDLAIVDPPYGINVNGMQLGSAPNRSKIDGSGPSLGTAARLKKERYHGRGKLKDRAFNRLNMDWDVPPSVEYFEELFRISKNQIIWGGNYFVLPPTRCIVCWDKVQPWDNFSQWEMAWTSFDRPAAMFRYSNTGGGNHEKKIHPTQKPIELYRWLLTKYAQPGMKILDTHGGSCSSVIACEDLGFEYAAFELDPEYYEAAIKRAEQFKSKLKLF
ncbi:DNA methyltransferase [Chitinophaga niabensis]|uniref:DNA methyltransferase n=1 Tax=Chitinophaga niabensis TaxID=536979 RepID=UPI0031B9E0A8